MLQNPKVLQPSLQIPHPPNPSTHPDQVRIEQFSKLSRRELAICGNSSLLVLLGSLTLEQPFALSKARAEESSTTTNANDQQEDKSRTSRPGCAGTNPTKRAFLDISIDGKPVGRIIIGLYGGDVPVGAARFSDLVSGAAGLSYRRKEFIKIMPNYVQHGGMRSYGVDAELASRTGSNFATDSLVEEWQRINEQCPGTKNLAGSVGIIVRDPLKPPPKIKLVARNGKLEIDEEEVGKDPNGTEFVIATKDSPELDSSALVVGRVLEGMEVVEKIGQVKTVQENSSSPYFRVAKLVGDKRAVVAERGFNRPYSKVIVTNCGLMDAAAIDFQVGGEDGWIVPKPKYDNDIYNQWASKNRFKVNDTVPAKDEKCRSTRPSFFANNGDTIFKLDRPELFDFISGVSGHCEKEQKMMIIKVLETESDSLAPSQNQNSTPPSHKNSAVMRAAYPCPLFMISFLICKLFMSFIIVHW